MFEKKIKLTLLIITVMEFVVRYLNNLLFKETGNPRV